MAKKKSRPPTFAQRARKAPVPGKGLTKAKKKAGGGGKKQSRKKRQKIQSGKVDVTVTLEVEGGAPGAPGAPGVAGAPAAGGTVAAGAPAQGTLSAQDARDRLIQRGVPPHLIDLVGDEDAARLAIEQKDERFIARVAKLKDRYERKQFDRAQKIMDVGTQATRSVVALAENPGATVTSGVKQAVSGALAATIGDQPTAIAFAALAAGGAVGEFFAKALPSLVATDPKSMAAPELYSLGREAITWISSVQAGLNAMKNRGGAYGVVGDPASTEELFGDFRFFDQELDAKRQQVAVENEARAWHGFRLRSIRGSQLNG